MIKKYRLLIIVGISFIFENGLAQEFQNKNLQGIVNAERAFSLMAKEKNTRDAFIHFLTDKSITFGKGAVIGIKKYQDQKPNDSWLSWQLDFAYVSASGDLGFDSGPWEFRNKKTDVEPTAFGHFISIWKKQTDGEWRNILDIGISHSKPEQKTTHVETLAEASFQKSTTQDDILSMEKSMIENISKNDNGEMLKYFSNESRLYHSNQLPIVSFKNIEAYLSNDKRTIRFTPVESQVSSAGDISYVYGTGSFQGKETSAQAFNYLHIWRKEEKVWKIVFEVISNW